LILLPCSEPFYNTPPYEGESFLQTPTVLPSELLVATDVSITE